MNNIIKRFFKNLYNTELPLAETDISNPELLDLDLENLEISKDTPFLIEDEDFNTEND